MTWGLDAVTVRFGSVTALDRVDLAVEPGRIEVVVGPDGAGKSTLARVLVGLVGADRGVVRRPDRTRVGYQPESAGTWRDLSVAENLQFVAATNAVADADERIADLLAVTDLVEAVGRLAGDLSGGMRQKLAVAMAMLARPDLLVLDEPTTGLDPVSRADIWRLLTRAAGEGAAIVATTAYLDEAQRAHHVVVLDDGAVLLAGTAVEIAESFPGRLVATDRRSVEHASWRRGRQWRTWVDRGDGGSATDRAGRVATPGDPLDPDLEDVVMAAVIRRREDTATDRGGAGEATVPGRHRQATP